MPTNSPATATITITIDVNRALEDFKRTFDDFEPEDKERLTTELLMLGNSLTAMNERAAARRAAERAKRPTRSGRKSAR